MNFYNIEIRLNYVDKITELNIANNYLNPKKKMADRKSEGKFREI